MVLKITTWPDVKTKMDFTGGVAHFLKPPCNKDGFIDSFTAFGGASCGVFDIQAKERKEFTFFASRYFIFSLCVCVSVV